MIDPIQFTRRYIDTLYDPDELLALVLLDGEPTKKWGKTTIGFYCPDDRETFYEHVTTARQARQPLREPPAAQRRCLWPSRRPLKAMVQDEVHR